MDVQAHFLSIASELEALRDRVRNFIQDNHWQTDGEWKESVLRTVLRRHVPSTYNVGRGFVITEGGCSDQIDVLIYDNSKPVLYKDGDLAFVTADAVRAIIEVKPTATMAKYRDAVNHLAKNAELIRANRRKHNLKRRLFVGLFAYKTDIRPSRTQDILSVLQNTAERKIYRVINHVCLGPSMFIRFWSYKPNSQTTTRNYNRWHIYNIENLSAGYFINNVLERLADDSFKVNRALWFPLDKEIRRVDTMELASLSLSKQES